MHATIRRYGTRRGSPEQWAHAWRALANLLSRARGFVSSAVVAEGAGGYAWVGFFDAATSQAAGEPG